MATHKNQGAAAEMKLNRTSPYILHVTALIDSSFEINPEYTKAMQIPKYCCLWCECVE